MFLMYLNLGNDHETCDKGKVQYNRIQFEHLLQNFSLCRYSSSKLKSSHSIILTWVTKTYILSQNVKFVYEVNALFFSFFFSEALIH